MVCPTCYKSSFRLSHFRSMDLPALFTLRYPVRCRACSHRMYAGPMAAFQVWQDRRRKGQILPDGNGAH